MTIIYKPYIILQFYPLLQLQSVIGYHSLSVCSAVWLGLQRPSGRSVDDVTKMSAFPVCRWRDAGRGPTGHHSRRRIIHFSLSWRQSKSHRITLSVFALDPSKDATLLVI